MNFGKSYKESLKEYARGIIGGLLFSFPLLFTMEVWWAGYTTKPLSLIVFVVFTYIVLLGYNRYAGMHPGVNWKNIFMESIEEMGIGMAVAFIVLFLLDRIEIRGDFDDGISKVVIEAMLVSIGVSIGTAQMGSSTNGKEEEEEEKDSGSESSGSSNESSHQQKNHKTDRRTGKLALVILSICGSLLVSSSVAPTDEVWMLAVQCEPYQILAISVFSIGISMVTGYFSNFRGTVKSELNPTHTDIVFVTCLCYLSALFVSALLLWFFGRFEDMSHRNIINGIVVLGAIASIGASAGRLLIK